MLLREFINQQQLEDVDIVDDLHFFMHNDPRFYRKVMYPMISKLKNHLKSKKTCKDTVFRSCVDQAANVYCNQYHVTDSPNSVFTDVDRDELARRIFGEEQDNIKNGVYDRDTQ